jgi:NADH:ubiquinone oxidoreductase subunit H
MPVSGGGRSWLVDSKYTVLRWLRLTSLGVYGIIFSGWASGSRYPFLGSVRAVAQLISYELILVSVVFIISFVTFSFNFIEIINFQESSGWLAVPLFPAFLVFLVVGLAETNRTPFDLPEREAELVAGYNLEYSSLLFAFFFFERIREYVSDSSYYS